MRVCPNIVECPNCKAKIPCKYVDPPYWRRSFQRNTGGEIDICHINDLEINETHLADKLKATRGTVIIGTCYAYLFGKKAVYVKRIWKHLYDVGGVSAFSIPYELKPRLEEQLRKGKNQCRLFEEPKK